MFDLTDPLKGIAAEIDAGRRITPDEALALAEQAPLALLGLLAVRVKERKSGKEVYYNRNFHIEPTNVCVFNCRFCSYRRPAGSPEAWDYDEREILSQVEAHRDSGATEVHIVGGVHPRNDLYYYADLIRKIKRIMPQASVKAFTAIELAYMIRQADCCCSSNRAWKRFRAEEPKSSPSLSARASAPRKARPTSGSRCTARRTGSVSRPTRRSCTGTSRAGKTASTTSTGCARCRTKRADSTPSFRSSTAAATIRCPESAKSALSKT